MAMITCPECGKQISDKATACPNCGAALSAAQTAVVNNGAATAAVPKRRKKKVWIPIVIIAVILCIIAAIMIPSMTSGKLKTVTNKPVSIDGMTGYYTGDWQNDLPNGTGTFIMEADEGYLNDMNAENPIDEQGNHVVIDGYKVIYEGEFKDLLPYGQMKLTQIYVIDGVERKLIYEGNMKDGGFYGQGKITYEGVYVYEGELKNSAPNGHGKMTYSNGEVQEGEFKDGKFYG